MSVLTLDFHAEATIPRASPSNQGDPKALECALRFRRQREEEDKDEGAFVFRVYHLCMCVLHYYILLLYYIYTYTTHPSTHPPTRPPTQNTHTPAQVNIILGGISWPSMMATRQKHFSSCNDAAESHVGPRSSLVPLFSSVMISVCSDSIAPVRRTSCDRNDSTVETFLYYGRQKKSFTNRTIVARCGSCA